MKKLLFSLVALFSFSILFAQPPAGDANVGDVYGSNITASKIVKGKKINAAIQSGEPVNMQLTGKVLEVCPKKGCWVKLQLDDNSTAFVKMKDYAFFVPTSLEGKKVLIDGKVEMTKTSVKELKHYAEDAKQSQEEIDAITEPKEEIKILANGIKVVK